MDPSSQKRPRDTASSAEEASSSEEKKARVAHDFYPTTATAPHQPVWQDGATEVFGGTLPIFDRTYWDLSELNSNVHCRHGLVPAPHDSSMVTLSRHIGITDEEGKKVLNRFKAELDYRIGRSILWHPVQCAVDLYTNGARDHNFEHLTCSLYTNYDRLTYTHLKAAGPSIPNFACSPYSVEDSPFDVVYSLTAGKSMRELTFDAILFGHTVWMELQAMEAGELVEHKDLRAAAANVKALAPENILDTTSFREYRIGKGVHRLLKYPAIGVSNSTIYFGTFQLWSGRRVGRIHFCDEVPDAVLKQLQEDNDNIVVMPEYTALYVPTTSRDRELVGSCASGGKFNSTCLIDCPYHIAMFFMLHHGLQRLVHDTASSLWLHRADLIPAIQSLRYDESFVVPETPPSDEA